MKIAILGDTHFGMRNDSTKFHDYYEKFYKDVFFPYLKENGITDIFQLGDLFDRRKYINFLSLSRSKEYFFSYLQENNITLHTLVGNHDLFWRESVSVNAQSLVLGEYSNIKVYTEPTKVSMEDVSIDIIPWICRENEEQVSSFIRKSRSDLCFGHFEIAGFSMYKGMESHEGLEASVFKQYSLVCSGHYHTRSQHGNITYVGTPGEMTWQDYDDPRGFHVYDLEDKSLSFVRNPYVMFYKVVYDDKDGTTTDLSSLDLKDAFVRVVVLNKTDFFAFDNFIETLYNKDCFEIKIVEDFAELNSGVIDQTVNLEDTVDVLTGYVDSIDTIDSKDVVKSFMKSLYIEACNVEL